MTQPPIERVSTTCTSTYTEGLSIQERSNSKNLVKKVNRFSIIGLNTDIIYKPIYRRFMQATCKINDFLAVRRLGNILIRMFYESLKALFEIKLARSKMIYRFKVGYGAACVIILLTKEAPVFKLHTRFFVQIGTYHMVPSFA